MLQISFTSIYRYISYLQKSVIDRHTVSENVDHLNSTERFGGVLGERLGAGEWEKVQNGWGTIRKEG